MINKTVSAGHGSQARSSKEDFWRQTMRRFSAGGQSVRAFCRECGLSEPAFYAWRKRLNQRDAVTATGTRPRTPAPAFLPVRLAAGISGRIEVVLSNGHRIRLRGSVDQESLAMVVAALQGQSSPLSLAQ